MEGGRNLNIELSGTALNISEEISYIAWFCGTELDAFCISFTFFLSLHTCMYEPFKNFKITLIYRYKLNK